MGCVRRCPKDVRHQRENRIAGRGRDAAQFAQAIHSLLDEPELRATMGAAGRRKVERDHDIRKTREAFAKLFDQGASVSVSSTSRSTANE